MDILNKALHNPLWVSHSIGDTYTMDELPELWKIAYYPLLEDGKTGQPYDEPRALVEKIGVVGFWHKEVPLRYLSRTCSDSNIYAVAVDVVKQFYKLLLGTGNEIRISKVLSKMCNKPETFKTGDMIDGKLILFIGGEVEVDAEIKKYENGNYDGFK